MSVEDVCRGCAKVPTDPKHVTALNNLSTDATTRSCPDEA